MRRACFAPSFSFFCEAMGILEGIALQMLDIFSLVLGLLGLRMMHMVSHCNSLLVLCLYSADSLFLYVVAVLTNPPSTAEGGHLAGLLPLTPSCFNVHSRRDKEDLKVCDRREGMVPSSLCLLR